MIAPLLSLGEMKDQLEANLDFVIPQTAVDMDVKMLHATVFASRNNDWLDEARWQGHCIVPSRDPGGKGYVALNFPRTGLEGVGQGPRRIYGHRLAAMVKYGRDEVELGKMNGEEVSHLCHNKACFLPSHLVLEHRRNNTKRNACNIAKFCLGSTVHAGRACIFEGSRLQRLYELAPEECDMFTREFIPTTVIRVD